MKIYSIGQECPICGRSKERYKFDSEQARIVGRIGNIKRLENRKIKKL